jgi:hypothetical protein
METIIKFKTFKVKYLGLIFHSGMDLLFILNLFLEKLMHMLIG